MNCSTPTFPVYHYLPEFAKTYVKTSKKAKYVDKHDQDDSANRWGQRDCQETDHISQAMWRRWDISLSVFERYWCI